MLNLNFQSNTHEHTGYTGKRLQINKNMKRQNVNLAETAGYLIQNIHISMFMFQTYSKFNRSSSLKKEMRAKTTTPL